ncbi:unnamed protein product [marine sediment metagenome]|uniref:Uncharacterized protein n=1 Tax=marine sediment metagenome TaxID=412755 RepID=X1DKM5_9ZZZZ
MALEVKKEMTFTISGEDVKILQDICTVMQDLLGAKTRLDNLGSLITPVSNKRLSTIGEDANSFCNVILDKDDLP